MEDPAARAVAKAWDLAIPASTLASEDSVIEALATKVQMLIDGDPRALYQALYRLDVDEERARHVMQTEKGPGRARALAVLIYKREWQKAKSRMEYEEADEPVDRGQPRLPKKN